MFKKLVKKTHVSVVFLVLLFLVFPAIVSARIGVGVGIGKIVVDDILKPGVIYTLPDFVVLNTGDEAGTYGVGIAYHEGQPELQPLKDWVKFSPSSFKLEPGEVQQVELKLDLPLQMEPGDYFAYLEAFPIKEDVAGETSVGIAAAAKLYFTVEPASLVDAIYYKIRSFWIVYEPWPQISLGVVAFIILALIARKYISIDIGIKKKPTTPEHE